MDMKLTGKFNGMLVVQPQGRKVWVGLIWTWFRPAGSGVHLNQKGGVFAPESGKTYQQNGFAQSMTGKKKQPLSPQLYACLDRKEFIEEA
eukprot:861709-Pelagomonas_calceolata.AAC.1